MADRADLLDRLVLALSRPGVDGVLGTADILEDLLLLGALDGKVVIGSMNRGGLAGTAFEIDDRFTGYDADSIAAAGFDGGKMLLPHRPGRPGHRRHPGGLRARGQRPGRAPADGDGRAVHLAPGRRPGPQRPDRRGGDPVDDASAAGARRDLAYTWLKLPVVDEHGAGDGRDHAAGAAARRRGPAEDPDATYAQLEQGAARCPTVRGPGGRPVAALPAGRRRRRRRRRARWACCDRARGRRDRGAHRRGRRRRPCGAGGHPGDGRLGLQRPAGAASCPPAASATFDTGDGRDAACCRWPAPARCDCDGRAARR